MPIVKKADSYYVFAKIRREPNLAGDDSTIIDSIYCPDLFSLEYPTRLLELVDDDFPIQLKYNFSPLALKEYLRQKLTTIITERMAAKLIIPPPSIPTHQEEDDEICLKLSIEYEINRGFFATWLPRAGAVFNLITVLITALIIALSLRLTWLYMFKEGEGAGKKAAAYSGAITQLIFSLILYHFSDAAEILDAIGKRIDDWKAGNRAAKDPIFRLMSWPSKIAFLTIKYGLYFSAAIFILVNGMFFSNQIESVITDTVEEGLIDLSLTSLRTLAISTAVISLLPAAAFLLTFSQKLADNVKRKLAPPVSREPSPSDSIDETGLTTETTPLQTRGSATLYTSESTHVILRVPSSSYSLNDGDAPSSDTSETSLPLLTIASTTTLSSDTSYATARSSRSTPTSPSQPASGEERLVIYAAPVPSAAEPTSSSLTRSAAAPHPTVTPASRQPTSSHRSTHPPFPRAKSGTGLALGAGRTYH